MLAAAFSVALMPAIPGPALAAPEADIVEGPPAGLPEDTLEGARKLVNTLEVAGANPDQIEAARAFVAFVEANPEIIGKEISSLTEEQQTALLEGLANGAGAFEAIEAVTNVLASQDWLTEVNPDLAEQIKRECGRRFLGGRDMYAATAMLLQDPAAFDGDPVNLMEDVSGVTRECVENLRVYSRIAAEELQRLDDYISRKQQELQDARDRGDTEAAERIEAEIAEAEERRDSVKKGMDLSAILKILAGLGSIATGVAAIVASGGSCVPCYGEVVGGAIAVVDGINQMNETDEVGTRSPPRRPGVNPRGEPTDAERAKQRETLDADPRLAVIEPENPGGNFWIAKDENTGNIVIFQVQPELQITLDIAKATEGLLSNTQLLSLDDLGEVTWTRVGDPIVVNPTDLSIELEGSINGSPVSVTFVQNPVDQPVVVTVEAN